jgi:Na+/melibiose symporter-like transporter
MSSDKHERTTLTTVRSAFTILANLVVFIAAYFLFRNDTSQAVTPADESNFHYLTVFVVGTGLSFAALFCLLVKEEPSPAMLHQKGGRWHDWLVNRNFYLVGCVYMCTRTYVNVTQTYLSLYLLNSLEAPKTSIAVVPAAVFLVSFGATICCNWMARHLDSAQTTLVGIGFGLLGCVGFYLTPEGPGWILSLFASAAFGLGCGIVGVAALQMISDLLGYATCSSAFVYGVMSFADKVLNGSVMMMVQAGTPLSSSSLYRNYHRYAVSFLPAMACILGACLIITLKISGFPGQAEKDATPLLKAQSHTRRRSVSELRAMDTGGYFAPPSKT